MFKIGMKVVCISKRGYIPDSVSFSDYVAPNIGDIVTINNMWEYQKMPFLFFEEMPNRFSYASINYRPLQDQYTEEEIEAVNIDGLVEVEVIEV